MRPSPTGSSTRSSPPGTRRRWKRWAPPKQRCRMPPEGGGQRTRTKAPGRDRAKEIGVAKFGEGGDLVKCSFCGKSQKQVKKLIAGPGVYICDECIDLCNDIIAEERDE